MSTEDRCGPHRDFHGSDGGPLPDPTSQLLVPDYMKTLVDRLRAERPKLLKKLSFYDLQCITRPYIDTIAGLQRDLDEAQALFEEACRQSAAKD